MYCCDTFEAAQQSGTDNEGYSRLIHRDADGIFTVGQDLPAIRFCPWCRADVSKKHPLEVAARAVVDARYSGGDWGDLSEAIMSLGGALDNQSS